MASEVSVNRKDGHLDSCISLGWISLNLNWVQEGPMQKVGGHPPPYCMLSLFCITIFSSWDRVMTWCSPHKWLYPCLGNLPVAAVELLMLVLYVKHYRVYRVVCRGKMNSPRGGGRLGGCCSMQIPFQQRANSLYSGNLIKLPCLFVYFKWHANTVQMQEKLTTGADLKACGAAVAPGAPDKDAPPPARSQMRWNGKSTEVISFHGSAYNSNNSISISICALGARRVQTEKRSVF